MILEIYGGAGFVTGSCHILRVNNKIILLDCGLFQGKEDKKGENDKFPFNEEDIDYVILSHGHIDHSGRIPYLIKNGFKGEVICTNATKDLCEVMLRDSGNIQEMECVIKNKYREKKGKKALKPLYTEEEGIYALKHFKGVKYEERIELFEGVHIYFKDAGHLLGSAITEIYIKDNEDGKEKKLVYSGDIGNKDRPLIEDPSKINNGDYILMECTYGDTYHEEQDYFKCLIDIIKKTIKRGGNVIIPCFSIGRTQEILYILNDFVEKGEIKPRVFVDSPLAKKATSIFKKHSDDFDYEARELLKEGDDPLEFKNLVFTESSEESKGIKRYREPCIILSSSGMCDGGRIKYHLLNNIEEDKNSIVFVGYQSPGTLGRSIVDKNEYVRILGKKRRVLAEIHKIYGLSGHGDKKILLDWIESFNKKPEKIILVHGEEEIRLAFKNELQEKGYSVLTPSKGCIIKL
ncbi:MBL fold metallo-hydrolase RNA specificity domain-containing protein [Clostridium sp.]|uniref:MBL fold metallo-hydrolase RNA specificity domain-containing protein n=1 Tax=Clostridium sp. TaxID=1506 RepID=UPI0034641625